jgi:hypothetical protein
MTTSTEPLPAEHAVPLRDARRIVIRPVRAGDDVELMRLYDTLDDDDHYRRFFGLYHPDLDFYTEMANVAEDGGARLVAVLQAPGAADGIVGEAGYTLLPNGDGELAIVVARDWRGWLGPYLLDVLVETAAAAGVPNLEADVLSVNGPMIALLRSRGSVIMDHEGWSVVRLLIGTHGRQPAWPGPPTRPRVLVEGAGRWHGEDDARSAGLRVLTCPGPVDGLPGCPLMRGQPCRLASAADVIIVNHPIDDDHWRDLMAGHADVHPGVPVCIEPSHAAVDGADVPGCTVVGEADVVSFVRRLAREREARRRAPA